MNRKRLIVNQSTSCLGLVLLLTAAPGCSDDESNAEDAVEFVAADALTSATPRIDETLLTQEHAGWEKADCLTCHTTNTIHTSGYSTVNECATCHGANGAGLIPQNHAAKDCRTCHADSHQGLGLDSETQCLSCHRDYNADSLPACSYTGDYDVIVVGAGGGGLAAATNLTRAGKTVLVLEQHYKTGGAMVTFNRGDYTIEASLHSYDGLSLSYFEELGIRDQIETREGENMYRSIYPDFTLDIPADTDAYKAVLQQQFPLYSDQIDSLFETLLGMDIWSTTEMSVMDLMTAHGIDDMKLITVLSQLVGFVGASPENINASLYIGMWASFHAMGYHYLVGGSQSITDALTASVLENGGEILLNTRVTSIDIEDGKATGVQTANGGCYTADYIISNANEPDTYHKLVGDENLPAEILSEMDELEYAPPVSLIYLGVDHDYSDVFTGDAHEIWINSKYADEWFTGGPKCDPSREMSIANYSVLDPTAAPAGKNVIAITILIGYECDKQWNLGLSYDDYKAYKANLVEYYLDIAEESLPDLRKHIEVLEVASPSTVEKYTLNPEGSWAGWDLEFEDHPMTFFEEERHTTPISNLYLAGSWATTGGQSIVLKSGITVAGMIVAKMNEK